MNDTKNYVRRDEHDVMRVGASRVMLDSIVAAFDQGHSAETIQQQFPALSLEEVYGTIAFYLANLDEVNEYLKRQDKLWQEWRARALNKPSQVYDRLRATRAADVPGER